jgi:polyisoprenoid-binding protein YceI
MRLQPKQQRTLPQPTTMHLTLPRPLYLVAALAFPALACSRGEPRSAYASTPATGEQVATAAASPEAAFHFVVSPAGTAARYRVRERLVGHDLPNDAVGETKSVTGTLDLDAQGKVIRETSKFTLDASTFVSDQNRRDGYVRGRLLQADQYPTIEFVPSEVRGITLPIPTTGTKLFVMTGDLTVRGVTRPTTWTGSATFAGTGINGSASTTFTFDDIKLEPPRVPVLLSVADTIKLEIDFALARQR